MIVVEDRDYGQLGFLDRKAKRIVTHLCTYLLRGKEYGFTGVGPYLTFRFMDEYGNPVEVTAVVTNVVAPVTVPRKWTPK